MTVLEIPITQAQSGHTYTLDIDRQTFVGEVARYLSHYESSPTPGTLETIRLVPIQQRLQDIVWQRGDRLVLFTQAAHPIDPPSPLRPGDKTLRFSLGERVIHVRGKRGVLVGKSDDSYQTAPDVDLRHFVPPDMLESLSRGCLWLGFDDATQTWSVSRLGHTRVLIDDFELGSESVPLNDDQWVQFCHAADRTHVLGGFRLQVEEVRLQDDTATVKPGPVKVAIYVGKEDSAQLVRASENLSLEQIFTHLARYNQTPFTPDMRVYLARLVAPDTPIDALDLRDDMVLYAALNPRYAQNALRLRDIHRQGREFVLWAGVEDTEKTIGCRAGIAAPAFDVDLYDADTGQGETTLYGRFLYRATENTWLLVADEYAKMPMFLNSTRITHHSPVTLASGDVLTVGQSVHHYVTRLEICLH